METWTAAQLAISNGAYGGKTVTFVSTTTDGRETVTGELGRVTTSSENPDAVLMRVNGDWYLVNGAVPVEVA
jgi:hypothetical protein